MLSRCYFKLTTEENTFFFVDILDWKFVKEIILDLLRDIQRKLFFLLTLPKNI